MGKILKPSEIKIGLKFKRRKSPKCSYYIHEIVDILKTYNSKNELVKTEYVCEKDFLGQKMRSNYPIVSIQRAVEEHGLF